MNPVIQLSSHALERAQERLHLTPGEIVDLLTAGLTVPLGEMLARRPGVRRTHRRTCRLFYSQPDNFCFVAVQVEDGEVVTILPVDMAPWQVSREAMEQAKALVLGPASSAPPAPEPAPDFSREAPGVTAEDLPPYQTGYQRFELRCARCGKGGTIFLGRVQARPYGYSLETLVAHPGFTALVLGRIASLVKRGQVKTIFVTLGPLGSTRVHQMSWPPK